MKDNIFKLFSRLFSVVLVASCDSNVTQPSEKSGNSNVQNQKVPLAPCPISKYSKELVIKHDIAVTKWFLSQSNAIMFILIEGNNEIKIKKYEGFSKLEDNSQDVLSVQDTAIDIFSNNYQGDDRKIRLSRWYEEQKLARAALCDFLKAIKVETDEVSEISSGKSTYKDILNEQRIYLEKFEIYRREFKEP